MLEKQAIASTAANNNLNTAEAAQSIEAYLATKKAFIDFVLNAEDAIATALETFSAQQLSRWAQPTLSGLNRTDLAIDMFLSEGRIEGHSIAELFLQANPEALGQTNLKQWAEQWTRTFNGLFVVRSASPDSYQVMNWLTEKDYSLYVDASQPVEIASRIKPGEIVLARIAPIDESGWLFSGPLTLLGKLGKPKLAVAIGNFKKWFPQHLYGDAPELKEAAWESVARQYEDFLAFFGEPPVTLSGYELNKKFQAYQAQTTERQLAEAGLDSDKSLQELAKDAGISEEEIAEAMDAVGEENLAVKKLIESKQSLKMVMPKASLPDDIRKAESVTVFSHPRWGQAFLTDYSRLMALLATPSPDPETTTEADTRDRLVQKYLEEPRVNAHVWDYLTQTQGSQLEKVLRRVLNRPDFDIQTQLSPVLEKYGKSSTPELPDSASVPLHLHNLFQDALKAVGKSAKQTGNADQKNKSKKSNSKKTKQSGFGR
ncbi:MAG: hypothetical protein HLUCCA11_16190 [Phormidesmis priestleyi Ana]|uniref:Uncharacterized protein n=1 Tax=Phormidesmis priestleyi Ana TaxID=1666911 RepID=A0A0P8DD80_9CYAN|nr:MAG: hypothetical protein HLUCCA11_16190 [Phormidesmis priestleyi Ana]